MVVPAPAAQLLSPSRRIVPEGPFDLAIVGGGINGVGIARDATLRGLSVCLFEKHDYGSGTSSHSSKMLHGGMRYLEQLRLGLVFEALRERAVQLRAAPHLAAPQMFVIPIYEGHRPRRGPRAIRLGVALYDLLALGKRLGRGRFLDAGEVRDRVPGILESGLLGGGLYFDGVMDDARLALVNILDAIEIRGRQGHHFRNYAEVTRIRETSPLELEVHDRILERRYRVRAHHVVRVVGPWTDLRADVGGAAAGNQPLLAPSKGVHVVLPALQGSSIGRHGLLLTHARDGRTFFVIPWRGKTLVGTTETPFSGTPEKATAESAEVDYLLGELRRILPGHAFPRSEILAVFAGVRPLARPAHRWASPGQVSRSHRIVATGNGVITVVGGKYTTYRAIADQVVGRCAPGASCSTKKRPLPGGDEGPWERYRERAGQPWLHAFGEPLVERLFHRYGTRLSEVLDLVRADAALGEPLSPEYPEIGAEVVHGVLREEVCYPADFLCRRTDLRFRRGNGRSAYDETERLIRAHAATAPPDLDAAREAFLDELAAEDALRQEAAPSTERPAARE